MTAPNYGRVELSPRYRNRVVRRRIRLARAVVIVPPAGEYDGAGISEHSFASEEYDYPDTAALRAEMPVGGSLITKYQTCVRPDLATLDTSVLFNGHPTCRYDFPELSAHTCQPMAYFDVVPNGGDGSAGSGNRSNLWVRYRKRYTPGFNLYGDGAPGTSPSYKSMTLGWTGGHTGRGEIEYTFGGNINFQFTANNVSPPNSDIQLTGNNAVTVGSMWSDGLFHEFIINYYYTAARAFNARYWWHPAGAVPVKRATLNGTVDGTGAVPVFALFRPGANFNRTRDVGENLSCHWASWECADGLLTPNPFNLPIEAQ